MSVKYWILFGIFFCGLFNPVNVSCDTLIVEEIVVAPSEYNWGSVVDFTARIKNETNATLHNIDVIVSVKNGSMDIPLIGVANTYQITLAGGETRNESMSFRANNTGTYTINVKVKSGGYEHNAMPATVNVFATDLSVLTDKVTYSHFSNEEIKMTAYISNRNSTDLNYIIDSDLVSPSGNVLHGITGADYNVTIPAGGTYTHELTYKITSADTTGDWVYRVKAFPQTHLSASIDKQVNIKVETVSFNLDFIPPEAVKYNTPVMAYAKVSNSGTVPVLVDLGFVVFSTTGTGGAVLSGEKKSISVSPNALGMEQTVTMYLQQMAYTQNELPVGAYSLTLYGKIQGTDISVSKQYDLNIIENIPTSNYSMYLITDKPQVGKDVEFEFVLSNQELDKTVEISSVEFYVQNPADRTVYNFRDTNVRLTKRGTFSSSKVYNIKFKPPISGTYVLYVRINDGSEKEVSRFQVGSGEDTKVGISNVTFSPSNTLTTSQSVQVSFKISNLGAIPEPVDYSIYTFENQLVGLSGSTMVGGSVESVDVTRTITGSQFVMQENIPIKIVLSGNFAEVVYPTTITVTNPSGQKSAVQSVSMDKTFYQIGSTGTLVVSIQNLENFAVTNYISVNYPSDGSATGEKRKIVHINPSASERVELPVNMNSVRSGVGITVQLEGTRGEAVDNPDTVRFDILSAKDFEQQNKSVIAINFWKGIATSTVFILVGIIVATLLIFKVVKKKKSNKVEEM